MSRSFKVNRNGHDYIRSERVDWLDQFANNIDKASKTAVEVARDRSEQSVHERIHSIMNNQSGRTVESVVTDMQERTGLKSYLQSLSNEKSKVAQVHRLFPDMATDLEDSIKSFIDNNIATHHGQTTVPAVQHEVLSIFKNSGIQPDHLDNEPVVTYINKAIARQQGLSPAQVPDMDLGKGVGVVDVDAEDPANTDFMHNMMPVSD
jgi:uncharacterized protein (DUF849 family)